MEQYYKERSGRTPYGTDLSLLQSIVVQANADGLMRRLRKHSALDIIDAIAYLVKTGCQWSMLPKSYPPSKTVYHHFRSLSDRGWFDSMLRILVEGRRGALGQPPDPEESVVDSQSVRSGLPQSEKGIDGNKRIKGIKRHVSVESNGYVLSAVATKANTHDSKGAIPLIVNVMNDHRTVCRVKADLGYRSLESALEKIDGITLECVKSNFGTPRFIPLQGRWVVERTFSWMDNFRRLTRNYEKLLKVAAQMFIAACVFFMLRYFC